MPPSSRGSRQGAIVWQPPSQDNIIFTKHHKISPKSATCPIHNQTHTTHLARHPLRQGMARPSQQIQRTQKSGCFPCICFSTTCNSSRTAATFFAWIPWLKQKPLVKASSWPLAPISSCEKCSVCGMPKPTPHPARWSQGEGCSTKLGEFKRNLAGAPKSCSLASVLTVPRFPPLFTCPKGLRNKADLLKIGQKQINTRSRGQLRTSELREHLLGDSVRFHSWLMWVTRKGSFLATAFSAVRSTLAKTYSFRKTCASFSPFLGLRGPWFADPLCFFLVCVCVCVCVCIFLRPSRPFTWNLEPGGNLVFHEPPVRFHTRWQGRTGGQRT